MPATPQTRAVAPEGACEADLTPPAPKRRRKEKTPEELATAEAAKADKQRAKEEEKKKAKEDREAAKQARQAELEQEKRENAALRVFDKDLGDEIKRHVQGRSTSFETHITDAQYNYVFKHYRHLECEKSIITECKYGDGRVERSVQRVGKGLFLGEGQVQSVFGVTKTRGGSFNGFHGSTQWNILTMTVTRPAPGRLSLKWKLSSNANF